MNEWAGNVGHLNLFYCCRLSASPPHCVLSVTFTHEIIHGWVERKEEMRMSIEVKNRNKQLDCHSQISPSICRSHFLLLLAFCWGSSWSFLWAACACLLSAKRTRIWLFFAHWTCFKGLHARWKLFKEFSHDISRDLRLNYLNRTARRRRRWANHH